MTITEIVLLVVVAALAALGIYWWMMPSDHEIMAEPFQPRLGEYLTLMDKVDLKMGLGEYANDEGIRVPVVAIDVDNRAVDPLQSKMPEVWRTADPNQVASVLLIKCATEKVGDYGGGEDAYAHECRLWAVDRQSDRVVWMTYARRSPPRRIWLNIPFKDVIADRPETELIEHLTGAMSAKR